MCKGDAARVFLAVPRRTSCGGRERSLARLCASRLTGGSSENTFLQHESMGGDEAVADSHTSEGWKLSSGSSGPRLYALQARRLTPV